DGEATRTTEAPVAAGNYTVTAAFEVEEHYNSVPAKLAVLSIKKAVIDMSGVTFPNISVEQGTNYTPAITGVLPPGVTVRYTYYQDGNPVVQQPTAVGSYTIIAGFTVADSDNYATIASINASLTIVETALKNADMTGVHFNGPEAVVYDGTPKTLTIATPLPAGVQSVSYTYYKDNPDGSVTGLVGAPTDAGEYIVQANFTPETGYNPILSMSTPLVINKADSVLSGVSLDDKTVVYDGTEKILELSGYTPGTIPGIKAVSYLYIKAGESEGVSKAPRDVGTYSVHAIFTVDDNYNNPGIITAQLKIQGRDVDLTGINYGDKTVKYTGTPQKNEITDVLPAGVDQVTYTYLKDGDTTVIEEAPTEVGSYSVRAAFTVESNYNLVPPKTVRLTICAVDIDMAGMTLDSQNFVYDGQEKLISLKGEVPEGIEETVYYYQKNNPDGTAEEATTVRPKNAGDYTVRAVFKTAKGYNPVDPMMARMHIEKAGINTDLLYFYSQSLTYDGTPKTLAITGQLPEGITGITYRYLPEGASSASDTAPIDVGRYTVKAVFTVDANHNAIADQLAVLTIVKAT
ncbi:MAG: MBG domain-containing protein, partial [Eubacterium sp.]